MKKRTWLGISIIAVILIITIIIATQNRVLTDADDDLYFIKGTLTKFTYNDGDSNFLEASNKKPSNYIDITSKGIETKDLSPSKNYWSNASELKCNLQYKDVKQKMRGSRDECYSSIGDIENEYLNPETATETEISKTDVFIMWGANPLALGVLAGIWFEEYLADDFPEEIRMCHWIISTDVAFKNSDACEDYLEGKAVNPNDIIGTDIGDTGDYSKETQKSCVEKYADQPAKLLECKREAQKEGNETELPKIICSQAGQTGCEPPIIDGRNQVFNCEDVDCGDNRTSVCKINKTSNKPYCQEVDSENKIFNTGWLILILIIILILYLATRFKK